MNPQVTDDRAEQYCTFYLGQLLFGVAVPRVQEVLRRQPIRAVPLAPPEVCGLINLRGQIVTAIDLRHLLGIPQRGDGPPAFNVVIRSDDGLVGLLADEIGGVVEVGNASFERPPETLDPSVRALVPGVFKLCDRLMHVLDIDEALRPSTSG